MKGVFAFKSHTISYQFHIPFKVIIGYHFIFPSLLNMFLNQKDEKFFLQQASGFGATVCSPVACIQPILEETHLDLWWVLATKNPHYSILHAKKVINDSSSHFLAFSCARGLSKTTQADFWLFLTTHLPLVDKRRHLGNHPPLVYVDILKMTSLARKINMYLLLLRKIKFLEILFFSAKICKSQFGALKI